ncbi:MAG: fructose-bisphosphate aldolase class I [Xanthomonadales bacterium]|nr:fructose-bisphosphate aldolase class I [Xanthomonadales bacterium]
MNVEKLAQTAQAMVAEGRGILAIDESSPTIKKRFKQVKLESTEENRRAYREMLLSTAGLGEFISGAILFDETLRQSTSDGVRFVDQMKEAGILPGIKVDKGAHRLAGHPGEKVTEGLDGLRPRLAEYAELGAEFAKWRAVITIGDGTPSSACVEANAHALARYAALCQEADLVPIVEPEVLMNGEHDLDTCFEVTEATLRSVFAALYEQNVLLEGAVLKASMVISGDRCPNKANLQEVAEGTLQCLYNSVPAAMAGVVFLSGGQTEVDATRHLNAMNQIGPHPWPLSFSYGRALQHSALKKWGENPADNVQEAQEILLRRARCNGQAAMGQYEAAMESA